MNSLSDLLDISRGFSLVILNQLMFLLIFNDNTSERRKSVSWVETKACTFF